MSDKDRDYGAQPTGAAGTGQASGAGGSPADQLGQSLKTVTDALKSAGERVTSSSQELGQCAMRQAEQNFRTLFDTLRAMSATRSPAEVGELYTRFVSDSAKTHADQLREMGELLARSSREAWAPVTEALAKQTPK